MTGALLMACVVGIASGIVARSFFIIDLSVLALVCGACVALAGVWYMSGRMSARTALAMACVSVGFLCGTARLAHEVAEYAARSDALALFTDQHIVIEGVVVRDPERRDAGWGIVVQTEVIHDVPFTTLIQVQTDRGHNIAYGDRVRVRGTLSVPHAFETDNERTFRYREYLAAQGITHTLSFANIEGHERVTGAHMHSVLLRALYSWKHALVEGIERMLPEPHAGLAAGLLLGEKGALGAQWEETFRTVGLVHIIVLSGYNLTILAEFLMRLLSTVFFPRTRIVVGMCTIVLFALMVGLSATVVRATVMAVLVLLARAWGKTYEALRALALAGVGMVLWNPFVLCFDPGFQLSFLATLGLIVLAPIMERVCARVPTFLSMREYVTTTMATQIMVVPYMLYSFGAVSLVSLGANVLVLPVVPLAMLLSLISGMAGVLIGEGMHVLGYPAYIALGYILGVAERLADIPFAQVVVPQFSLWYMCLLYGVLSVMLMYWYRGYSDVSSPTQKAGSAGFLCGRNN